MNKITRKLLRDIRPEIDEALRPLAQKYGIRIQATTGREWFYGASKGDIKLTFVSDQYSIYFLQLAIFGRKRPEDT